MSLSRTLELFLKAALEDMHPVNQIDQSQDLPVCEHEAERSFLEAVYEELIQRRLLLGIQVCFVVLAPVFDVSFYELDLFADSRHLVDEMPDLACEPVFSVFDRFCVVVLVYC